MGIRVSALSLKYHFAVYLLFLLFYLCSCQSESVAKPEAAKKIAQIHEVYKAMSLEEKIGQLFLTGLDGDSIGKAKGLEKLSSIRPGGLILFTHNLKQDCPAFPGQFCRQSAKDISNFIDAIQNSNSQLSNLPLFLSIDQEGGQVFRINGDNFHLPSAWLMGKSADDESISALSYQLAKNLKGLGFHINFAPVADINNNIKNPVIGNRSFGKDTNTLIPAMESFLRGHSDAGLLSCVKHFPGHGDTDTDSHLDLPVINKSKKELLKLEVLPFARAIKQGVPMVMSAHLLIPALDKEAPISLSSNALRALLRREMGFSGLIISDDLSMGGVSPEGLKKDIAAKAFIAGNDLLLFSSYSQGVQENYDYLLKLFKNKKIPESRLEASVLRILLAKVEAGLIQVETKKYFSPLQMIKKWLAERRKQKRVEAYTKHSMQYWREKLIKSAFEEQFMPVKSHELYYLKTKSKAGKKFLAAGNHLNILKLDHRVHPLSNKHLLLDCSRLSASCEHQLQALLGEKPKSLGLILGTGFPAIKPVDNMYILNLNSPDDYSFISLLKVIDKL